ncbi:MAG: DUF5602 domain-containing protein [Gemmatimonadales bacterium]
MSPTLILHRRATQTLWLLTLLAACDDASPPAGADAFPTGPAAQADAQGHTIRHYGTPVRVGEGTARTYVLVNTSDRDVPLEVGVALSEGAMEGLPAATANGMAAMAGHGSMLVNLLALPELNPTPYQFVELDWNPAGHEPAAIYGIPHFDFHFYTVSRETRSSILPSDPRYAEAAASFPAAEFRPPFYLDAATAAGAPAWAVTVPQMGLHWFDVRAPELQAALGNPAGYQPFTRTFIKGTWDGRFIFDEPMITRAWLLTKRISSREAAPDEIISVPTAERYAPAGYYPQAYRVAYDPRAREFLVGLTQLAARE